MIPGVSIEEQYATSPWRDNAPYVCLKPTVPEAVGKEGIVTWWVGWAGNDSVGDSELSSRIASLRNIAPQVNYRNLYVFLE